MTVTRSYWICLQPTKVQNHCRCAFVRCQEHAHSQSGKSTVYPQSSPMLARAQGSHRQPSLMLARAQGSHCSPHPCSLGHRAQGTGHRAATASQTPPHTCTDQFTCWPLPLAEYTNESDTRGGSRVVVYTCLNCVGSLGTGVTAWAYLGCLALFGARLPVDAAADRAGGRRYQSPIKYTWAQGKQHAVSSISTHGVAQGAGASYAGLHSFLCVQRERALQSSTYWVSSQCYGTASKSKRGVRGRISSATIKHGPSCEHVTLSACSRAEANPESSRTPNATTHLYSSILSQHHRQHATLDDAPVATLYLVRAFCRPEGCGCRQRLCTCSCSGKPTPHQTCIWFRDCGSASVWLRWTAEAMQEASEHAGCGVGRNPHTAPGGRGRVRAVCTRSSCAHAHAVSVARLCAKGCCLAYRWV